MSLIEKLNAASGVLGASTAMPLYPYVGTAYSQPTSALRIACIGINAYVSPKDWPSMSPGSFANWFANRRYVTHQRHRDDRARAPGHGRRPCDARSTTRTTPDAA